MQERGAYFHIETFPNVNKGQAALSFRGRMNQGKVRFPSFAPWWQRAEEQMLKFTGSGDDREDDFVDACSRIGQGLQMQIGASREAKKTNVVSIRPGTGGWMFQQYQHAKKAAKRSAVRGM
jgi:hypothetical protein